MIGVKDMLMGNGRMEDIVMMFSLMMGVLLSRAYVYGCVETKGVLSVFGQILGVILFFKVLNNHYFKIGVVESKIK